MKKVLFLFSIFMLCFGALSAQTVSISGVVTNSSTQAPIPNHQVSVYHLDSVTGNYMSMNTLTDANGWYSFSTLPPITGASLYVVHTTDCQNQIHYQSTSVTSSSLNFSICVSGSSTSCVASFGVLIDTVQSNTVLLSDQSIGSPTSWFWDFGDGNTSTLQNPSHTYANAGTYMISLTISGANCQSWDSAVVVVGTIVTTCTANFGYGFASGTTNTVNFNNLSTASNSLLTTYFWDFDDGPGSTSTQMSPQYTFSQPGTYNVMLKMNNNGCIDSIVVPITIQNQLPCMAAYQYYVDSVNHNTIHFFDISTGNITSWAWDFGDGTTSNMQSPSHTFLNGTYNVSLTVGGPNCSGGQVTLIQIITVNSGPSTYPDIYGQVRVGNDTTIAGTANLYVANTGALYATMPITSAGNYYFNNVPVGNYVVAAYPDSNSTYFGTHMNTYYGDVVNWANATVINHTQQLSVNYPIELQAMAVTPGAGQVSGNVGNNSKSGISGVHVYLLNDNDEVVKSDITNTSGDYNLGSIDVGNYEIYVEMPGYTSTPKQIVLTSNANQSIGNDFVVSGNTVVPVTTSITDLNTIAISTVYPNPVTDILNISMTSTELQEATVSIYSLSGQLLYSEEFDLNYESNYKVNMEAFEKGTYLVSVSSVKGEVQRILINKM
jgi:PKD repeat protein